MDAAAVSRLIGLIPERTARNLSGTRFIHNGSERAELLGRFLNWLGPINPLSKEEQQLFGLRAAPTKPLLLEGEEEPETAEEREESAFTLPEAGTHIAA